MFKLFAHSQSRYPTIRQALVQMGVSAAADPAQVSVLETRGLFSGRRVNFFRAYEPAASATGARSTGPRAFSDFDNHPDLLVGSGHVEHSGQVVVDARSRPEGDAPAREPADRAAHTDDHRLVFWDAQAAQSSEALLSAPAATWMHARSTPA